MKKMKLTDEVLRSKIREICDEYKTVNGRQEAIREVLSSAGASDEDAHNAAYWAANIPDGLKTVEVDEEGREFDWPSETRTMEIVSKWFFPEESRDLPRLKVVPPRKGGYCDGCPESGTFWPCDGQNRICFCEALPGNKCPVRARRFQVVSGNPQDVCNAFLAAIRPFGSLSGAGQTTDRWRAAFAAAQSSDFSKIIEVLGDYETQDPSELVVTARSGWSIVTPNSGTRITVLNLGVEVDFGVCGSFVRSRQMRDEGVAWRVEEWHLEEEGAEVKISLLPPDCLERTVFRPAEDWSTDNVPMSAAD